MLCNLRQEKAWWLSRNEDFIWISDRSFGKHFVINLDIILDQSWQEHEEFLSRYPASMVTISFSWSPICVTRWFYCHALNIRSNQLKLQHSFSIFQTRLYSFIILTRGRDSSVGIATRYGLDGPGIESRCGVRFSASVQTGPGAHPASYTVGTGSFPGVKRPGCGVDHPPPSRVEVEGRLELYPYSTSGSTWTVIGSEIIVTFTLLFAVWDRQLNLSLCHERIGKSVAIAIHNPNLGFRCRWRVNFAPWQLNSEEQRKGPHCRLVCKHDKGDNIL